MCCIFIPIPYNVIPMLPIPRCSVYLEMCITMTMLPIC